MKYEIDDQDYVLLTSLIKLGNDANNLEVAKYVRKRSGKIVTPQFVGLRMEELAKVGLVEIGKVLSRRGGGQEMRSRYKLSQQGVFALVAPARRLAEASGALKKKARL
jgi:hypothetical protein